MNRTIVIFLIICAGHNEVWCQHEFHVNDDIELRNILSVVDSRMLDTTSAKFIQAKQNVLEYCSKELAFNIDSTAILYSCREYTKVNPNATKKERRIIERRKLKYQFFVHFMIHSDIIYHTSFYLDSAMNVHYSSRWLFDVEASQLWSISPWERLSLKVHRYDDGYILPIKSVDIEYSDKHDRYVYVVLQEETDPTKRNKTSEYSGHFEVNMLIIDAVDGEILEKTKQGYSYISNPSW